MQKQRPHLRTAVASYAFGVGAAVAAFRLRRSAVAALAAIALLALVLPVTAGAHAFLASSTPASGTSLARAPHAVDLRFSEPVVLGLTTIQIFDARGAEHDVTRIRRGAAPRELHVTLPQLPTGAYRIAFKTVSQDDLHTTRGEIVFGAGTAAPAVDAQASAAPATSKTETAAHWLDLLSLSVLIGTCALLASGLPALVRSRISRFALVALPVLSFAGIVALTGKSSEFQLSDVLLHTPWGHAMLAREAAIAAVLAALALRRPRIAALLLAPVALAEAAAGHAGSLDVVALAAVAAHILAAGVWVGGLVVLAVVLPGLARADVTAALARFGRIAATSVAVVVVTGLYSAGRQIASVDALVSTTYGWSLVVKVGLLGATGALGLLGMLAVRRLRPSVLLLAAEATAAVAMLLAASVMLSTPPARGPQFAPAPAVVKGTGLATGAAADLLVDVAATPNRPGQNFVTATILDTQRPSPGAVRAVAVTFTRGTRHVTAKAIRVSPNRWQVGGTQLSVDGSWSIAVAIDRKGLARATYATPWVVSSPLPVVGTHPLRYSQRPLQPILSALALLLALAGAGAGAVWLLRRRRALESAAAVPAEQERSAEAMPPGGAEAEAEAEADADAELEAELELEPEAALAPAAVPLPVSASSARTPRSAQRRGSAPARGRRTRRRGRSRRT